MKDKTPVTAAIRVLREHKVDFSGHTYDYEEKGGTAQTARELGVDEHRVVKTLIMEDEHKKPMIVLMHGDCEVSTKNLARHLGVKQVHPCTPDTANKHSGYLVGGTSPFGTRHAMPVYLQRSVLELPAIFINGGKRGFQVEIAPQVILDILKPELVDVMA